MPSKDKVKNLAAAPLAEAPKNPLAGWLDGMPDRVVDELAARAALNPVEVRAGTLTALDYRALVIAALNAPAPGAPQAVVGNLHIVWQDGPRKETAVNGVQVSDVIDACVDHLGLLQSGPFPCMENAHSLDHLREAKRWQDRRTEKRIAQGVEGINRAHRS